MVIKSGFYHNVSIYRFVLKHHFNPWYLTQGKKSEKEFKCKNSLHDFMETLCLISNF